MIEVPFDFVNLFFKKVLQLAFVELWKLFELGYGRVAKPPEHIDI